MLAALQGLEMVLQEEAKGNMDEALLARKDAAVGRVQALLAAGMHLEARELEAVAQSLQSLMAANRFGLKWNGLRAQLAQLGQPKAPAPATNRPRLDLVH